MMYVYIIIHVEGFGCLDWVSFLWRALLVMYIPTQGTYVCTAPMCIVNFC